MTRITKTISVLAALVSVLAAAILAVVLSPSLNDNAPTSAQKSSAKPSFVFILADDMRASDLRYMPKTRSLLGRQGMRFEKAYVSNALCCPSRATIMRGQYAHNHGVWSNANAPDGVWQGYKNHGNESDNVATHLHEAGYRTGLFGKYFNRYQGETVPSGWDDWFAMTGRDYVEYDAIDNGTIRHFGTAKKDYVTNVLSEQTLEFIDDSAAAGEPFFAYIAPIAPHMPATPAQRDKHAFDGEKLPRSPAFNEDNVDDKPPSIRALPPLSDALIAKMDRSQENRAESLQAVDDLVEAVTNKLRSVGELDNTYVVFTSDNGLQRGEHRMQRYKAQPYEESIRMPLLILGPGVQTGSTTNKLTLNTDFLPTFMDLAGLEIPEYADGRSLKPLLEGRTPPWWDMILLEHRNGQRDNHPGTSFSGVLTSGEKKYIEYQDGFRELYDLNTDPYELTNQYNAATPPSDLVSRLQALETCAGTSCRSAENG